MTRIRRAVLAVVLLTLTPASLFAANGTLAPLAYQTVLDANANPVSGAKICVYLAGTTTATTTWTEVTLTTPNTNPIIADTSGRWVAYLQTGASYKFAFQDATGTAGLCDGAPIKTVDNIAAVPGSSASLDIVGTAGETLTAGQAVYLSDGSGSKTVGLWYKADSAQTYSSSAAVSVGMVPATIATGAAGTIRLAGQFSGLTSLVIGSTYYVGTAGALTTTQPTNGRTIGIADTTSSLVLNANPGLPNANNGVECFRLTLTTGVPVTTTDVTAATTLFATPAGCNRISLYDALGNATTVTSAQVSIAIPATTSQMYDVFVWNNAGVATLELLAWTNDTTRATAIVLTTTGSYTKSGDLTRRYLGSVRTTTVSGQTEDSVTKRYVWNYYNRQRRRLFRVESTASWTYTTAAIRQANGAAANQVEVVVGVAEVSVHVSLLTLSSNSSGSVNVANAIGQDSVTTGASGMRAGFISSGASGRIGVNAVELDVFPAIGRHYYAWLEYSEATGTTTWTGLNANGLLTGGDSGLAGWIDG